MTMLTEGLDFRSAVARLAAIAGLPSGSLGEHLQPSPGFKLAATEARAFDRWVSLKSRRLQHRWLALDDDWRACQAFIEEFWNEDSPDPKAVQAAHQRMNSIHEGKRLIDEYLDKLDRDPSWLIEPFLQQFYGDDGLPGELGAA